MTETPTPEQLLSDTDLFAGLSGRQTKKLAGRAKQVEHEAGREVAKEGLGGLAFHLILSGQATVSAHGREIRQLGSGDYFGEITMIDGKPRSATVTTSAPMRTLVISHADFEDLLKDEPEFARGLLLKLCARLREAEARG